MLNINLMFTRRIKMGFSFGGFSTSGIADSITGSIKGQASDMFDGFFDGSDTTTAKSYSLCCGYRDTTYSNKDFGFSTADLFNGLGMNINALLNAKFDMDTSQYEAWMRQLEGMMERLALVQAVLPIMIQILSLLKSGVIIPDKTMTCIQVQALATKGVGITGEPTNGWSLDNIEKTQLAESFAVIRDTCDDIANKEKNKLVIELCYGALVSYASASLMKATALLKGLSVIGIVCSTALSLFKPLISKIKDKLSGSISSILGLPVTDLSDLGDRLGLGAMDDLINDTLGSAYGLISNLKGKLEQYTACKSII